jgi:hypothetical protein
MTTVKIPKLVALERVEVELGKLAQSLSPISALTAADQPVPIGWWDTGERLTANSTSVFAIISNWRAEALFQSGATGVLTIPSPTTCFADLAGTVPCAPGDTCAFWRDTSGNDRHPVQATAAARPIFGRVPKAGKRNLSPLSEPTFAQLTNKTGVTDAANGLPGFDGTIQFPGGAVGNRIAYRDHGVEPNTEYTLSCFVRMDDGAAPVPGTDFTLVIGNSSSGVFELAPVEVSPGLWRVSRNATSLSSDLQNTGVFKTDSNSARGFRVSGFQLEAGASLTAYQRARSQFDITETGQRDCYYLYFGGPSDPRWMSTPQIDLTHTSQMSLLVGAEKFALSFAPIAVFGPRSDLNNGAFSLGASVNGNGLDGFGARGTVFRNLLLSVPRRAPTIYSSLADLESDILDFQANKNPPTIDQSGDFGGGTFRSDLLYIGSRAGTSAFLNGHIYGLALTDYILPSLDLDRAERVIAANTPEVQL